MRVITMAVVTLMIGVAVIGAWMMLGPGLPSLSNLGGDPVKKIARKREKFRSAPYVILVPAETLPEKVTSVQPKPSPVKIAPLAKTESSPAPEPVQKKPSPASVPAAPPAAKPPPVSKSAPIAKQTLDAILGPQAEPKPIAAPKLKTPAKTVPESKPKLEKKRPPAKQVNLKLVKPAIPKPKSEEKSQPAALVKPKPAALVTEPAASPPPLPTKKGSNTTKQQRELTYAVETKRRAGEQEKKQTLAIGEKVRFRRVVPQGAGRLKSNDNVIVLAGVDSLRGNSKCKYPSGKSWDCGRWANYALRRFIRGRAVVCDLIEEISDTEVLGNCKVAGKDINKWVVRRGWGQPAADNATAYAAALSAAKKDKLGLWSDEPKKAPPRAAPPPEPPVSETPGTEIPVTGITITEIPLNETPPTKTPFTETPTTEAPTAIIPSAETPPAQTQSTSSNSDR